MLVALPPFVSPALREESGIVVGGWKAARPIEIEVVGSDGTASWRSTSYSVRRGERREGTLTTPGGSRLQVTDVYGTVRGGLTLRRTVRVLAVGDGESAFSSRFSLVSPVPARIRDREFFAPGLWYRHNADVPKRALASDPDEALVLIREDRFALPLVMARDPGSGATIEMVHQRPDGATVAGDRVLTRLVDERMRFGSLGFVNDGRLRIAFQYPGSEGVRTRIPPGSPTGAARSHPLRVGFVQSYDLRVTTGASRSFADAVQGTWRRAFDEAAPVSPPVDLDGVYRASLDLLARYTVPYRGTPTVPFQARLPDGVVIDPSSQMGFVGKALPAAALLLKDALDRGDAGRQKQAEDVIDFWAANSIESSGVPKTWYDLPGEGRVTWRQDPTHLRVASDGMLGVLDAWHRVRRPAWIAYARRFGDFLLTQQAADGSLPAQWRRDGAVDAAYTNATYQAIPFLVELHRATGDARFRRAAVRAGEFCLTSVDVPYRYVGGTVDNPNVTDKESGVLAMQGFLALYGLTKERRWIDPAARAGTFAETWTYAWNVPIPRDGAVDPGVVYPKNRTTIGVSLIATGHSGADAFMAITAYDYYLLYLLTKDRHFLRFARMVLHAPRQLVDLHGELGYAHPGLLLEALSLVPPRGYGVSGWFPWLSVAVLDPMVRFREAYGTFDLDRIERLPFRDRLRRAGLE